MVAKLFETLLQKNVVDIKSRNKKSMLWFKDNITKISTLKNGTGIADKENLMNIRSWTNISIGSMYFMFYDPKHKNTLPYYDNFPLVIPIEKYKDGFLGLNLHYLPPLLRAKLMDNLYETLNNKNMDEKTKLIINYQILKSVCKNKYFAPCLKRYLGGHISTQLVKLNPGVWENALFMPVEQFKKQTKQQVWAESRRKIQ